MKTIYKYLLVLMMSASVPLAMAEEDHHRNCRDEASVEIDEMGVVNEEALQTHIDRVKEQMRNVHNTSGPRGAKKRELKKHLTEMQVAMQALHDQMYEEGCNAAKHGVSVEARVDVLEKRINMMRQMMDQLIENISEQEQEQEKVQ